jgi:hypothetical protein
MIPYYSPPPWKFREPTTRNFVGKWIRNMFANNVWHTANSYRHCKILRLHPSQLILRCTVPQLQINIIIMVLIIIIIIISELQDYKSLSKDSGSAWGMLGTHFSASRSLPSPELRLVSAISASCWGPLSKPVWYQRLLTWNKMAFVYKEILNY